MHFLTDTVTTILMIITLVCVVKIYIGTKKQALLNQELRDLIKAKEVKG